MLSTLSSGHYVKRYRSDSKLTTIECISYTYRSGLVGGAQERLPCLPSAALVLPEPPVGRLRGDAS